MAETLMLDHYAIREAAVRLQMECDNINDCIDKMRAVIYTLPEVWETDTCDRYVDRYLELEPGMKEMADLIADMVTQMDRITADFRDTASGMAG